MSDEQHKSELTSLVEDLMADIDSKPIHPKNKILLYSRYLLSKLSWHFTVSSLSKTWVIENIDTKVNSYIRKWLDIPIRNAEHCLPNSKQIWSQYLPPICQIHSMPNCFTQGSENISRRID